VKLVEPKAAPLGKSAKVMFDPKPFLANVGEGKAIFKFRKDQHLFEQCDVAGPVFYIRKRKVKRSVLSDQGKASRF
jgi:hypothetical protein